MHFVSIENPYYNRQAFKLVCIHINLFYLIRNLRYMKKFLRFNNVVLQSVRIQYRTSHDAFTDCVGCN